jgi:siroheme synthase
VLEATISSLADRMEASGGTGPVIVLIGKAMEGAEANWLSLWGKAEREPDPSQLKIATR